jgi:2',3'-cyclic-nucleotide 2'-phosphodiesterase (5'-nucleotidase family)
MQALPLRSMSKSQPDSDKTWKLLRFRVLRAVCAKLLLLASALALPVQSVPAQQGTAIQPCSTPPCASNNAPAPVKSKARVSQTLIDASIPDDPAMEKLLAPYAPKVRALNTVIGKLEGELRKGQVGAGNLGNFVADGIRSQASIRLGKPVLLAITNSGGLRKNSIAEGELRAADIFELLPFENALVEIDLTGEQLLKLLGIVLQSRDAQSGANIKYRMTADNRPEMVSVKLVDAAGHEVEIDPKTTYTIVTIDYLLNLASGNYSILQQGKNVKPLGVTIRDAIMDYVKAETAAGRPVRAKLDCRFALITPPGTPAEVKP